MRCKEIEERCSTRFFKNDKEIPEHLINELIQAAAMAPSGHNLQPWRFKVIKEKETIQKIATIMKENSWIGKSSCLVIIGLAAKDSYDIEKDAMAIGAAIENMLLEATSNQVDSCWVCGGLGNEVHHILHVSSQIKLMALIAMGYSRVPKRKAQKKKLEELMF